MTEVMISSDPDAISATGYTLENTEHSFVGDIPEGVSGQYIHIYLDEQVTSV